MTFNEKLSRLMRNMNLSAVARCAGVPRPTVEKYCRAATPERRPVTPGIDAAAKLARALGVDPGWLIDDTKGWPPVRVGEREMSGATSA